jgi:ComF family protein
MKMAIAPIEGLMRLIFPRPCPGCSREMFRHEVHICSICLHQLPYTNMEYQSGNYIQRRLSGRVDLRFAAAMLHFFKGGIAQKLLHAVKYKGNRTLAHGMGMTFGHRLADAGVLRQGDLLIPVPLHPHKYQIRGFNQSTAIAEGIAESTGLEICEAGLSRVQFHHSQTRKGREERWEDIKADFKADENLVRGKDVIIIDDVCTTGATAEACSAALLEAGAKSISLLTLAVTGDYYQ